jgi:hypothetical protein
MFLSVVQSVRDHPKGRPWEKWNRVECFTALPLIAFLRKGKHAKNKEGEITSLKMEEEDYCPEPCSCLQSRKRAG